MKIYKNRTTGEYWTEEEIMDAYEQFKGETDLTLEQTMADFDECDGYEESALQIIKDGLYQAAVDLMDDDIREDLHYELAPCTDEKFLITYMERHYEKYGIDFVI